MRGVLETKGVDRPICLSELASRVGVGGDQRCLRRILGSLESSIPRIADLVYEPLLDREIIWEDATGPQAYYTWSKERQAELQDAFEGAWMRVPTDVPLVPANQLQLADADAAQTILSIDDAWAYFKASVSQTLAIEFGGGWLPRGIRQPWWTILNYTIEQRAQLLDSREMFHWNAAPAGYRIVDTYHGRAVPAPPAYAYAFLFNNNLFGGTETETAGLLVGWCMNNLFHFFGGVDAANMDDNWQYRGWPPVARMIEGTVITSESQYGLGHPSAGCWGTVGFLRAVLRAANVPVKLVSPATHAHPWFMADGGRYLSHGDDPYGFLWGGTPEVPGESLLIDQAAWDAWFGAGLTDAQRLNNVDRGVGEVLIQYLPNALLHMHCGDIASGTARTVNSSVYAVNFYQWYTVADLEANGLWDRLDAKVASFGGCGHIPPPQY